MTNKYNEENDIFWNSLSIFPKEVKNAINLTRESRVNIVK